MAENHDVGTTAPKASRGWGLAAAFKGAFGVTLGVIFALALVFAVLAVLFL